MSRHRDVPPRHLPVPTRKRLVQPADVLPRHREVRPLHLSLSPAFVDVDVLDVCSGFGLGSSSRSGGGGGEVVQLDARGLADLRARARKLDHQLAERAVDAPRRAGRGGGAAAGAEVEGEERRGGR